MTNKIKKIKEKILKMHRNCYLADISTEENRL